MLPLQFGIGVRAMHLTNERTYVVYRNSITNHLSMLFMHTSKGFDRAILQWPTSVSLVAGDTAMIRSITETTGGLGYVTYASTTFAGITSSALLNHDSYWVTVSTQSLGATVNTIGNSVLPAPAASWWTLNLVNLPGLYTNNKTLHWQSP